MNIGRLQGKVAIVTGAGSGFGQGIAERFAAEGCAVVVNDIGRDAGERVAAGIRNRGGRAQFVHGDVSKNADVAQLVAATLAHFGALHVVVNNAGTTHRNQPLLDVGEDEFDRVYAVNVKSIYLTAKHVVPYFRKVGGGVFVNVASTAGVRPRPGLVWYNGTKGAVIVTENRARFLATIPLGRMSKPADVANACLFLASDEAEFITGACLEVDGGRCV